MSIKFSGKKNQSNSLLNCTFYSQALLVTFVTVATAAPYYDPYHDPYGYGYAPSYGYQQPYPNYPVDPYQRPVYPEPYPAYPAPYPVYPNSYGGVYPNYPQPHHPYDPYNAYPPQANHYQSQQANLYGNRVVSANIGQNRVDTPQGGLANFDPKTMMNDARKYAQSTRAVADLVDNVGNTASQNPAIGGLASLFGKTACFKERHERTWIRFYTFQVELLTQEVKALAPLLLE